MISILQAEGLLKRFGDHILFENLSLSIHERGKVALIARNGAGKTTLLNILAGLDSADQGNITRKQGLKLSYLHQEPELDDRLSVIEQVLSAGDELSATIRAYEVALETDNQPEIARLSEFIDNHHAWDFENRVHQVLSRLDLHHIHQPVAQLSGGQRKRVALASALISSPDLLILDEPTNHLDLAMIEWLETYLRDMPSALLLVTHDRYFLDNVCSTILELEDKQIRTYEGNYSYFLEKKEALEAAHQASVDKAQNLMRTELDWIRRQPKARGTKAKYRVEAFEGLKEKASAGKSDKNVTLHITGQRIGNKILEIKDLCFSYPNKPIITNFSYIFAPGDKIGLVGANGAGKSTLLNLFTGQLKPASGTIETGQTVVYGYYRQEGIEFDNEAKVIDAVRDIAEVVSLSNGTQVNVSQFLTSFLFPPAKQQQFIAKLSGGEKRRLYLATVLMQNPNFLILDEPTNDLDIATLQVLENYLIGFKGCVLVVSHDRFFMNKIVNHVFALNHEGQIKDIPGNYNDYADYRDALAEDKARRDKMVKQTLEPSSPPKPATAKKAGFKEKNEYQQLGSRIAHLEAEKQKLEQTLASGSLPIAEITEASSRLGVVINELDEASYRWLELDELLN